MEVIKYFYDNLAKLDLVIKVTNTIDLFIIS